MTDQLPESNADIVALNLVDHAIVDDIIDPGEALAKLFDRMAEMARDIGGDHRVANADWQELFKTMDRSDIEPVVDRQAQAMGDTWSKRWMLCMMAKRLHKELEAQCLDHPASSKIERVTYARDGLSNHGRFVVRPSRTAILSRIESAARWIVAATRPRIIAAIIVATVYLARDLTHIHAAEAVAAKGPNAKSTADFKPDHPRQGFTVAIPVAYPGGMKSDSQFPIIEIPSSATLSPEAVIEYLVDRLLSQHQINETDAATAKQRVMYRESLGSTAIGRGVAIPHAFGEVKEVAGVIGRSSLGIVWPGGQDETAVRLICLVITPITQQEAWPDTLEKLAAQIWRLV